MDYEDKNASGHVTNTFDPEKSAFQTDTYSPSDPQRRQSALGFEEQLVDAEKYGHTTRGLKSRHIQLLALGGAIGTGLFVGSGQTLATVGPADFFMAFAVMSVIIWFVTQSLAEMTTWLPVPGASVPFYINRFWDPSLAFASGWNYWYTYAILVAAEISAASIVIDYWTTKVHVAVWITILLVVVVALNIFAVKFYGEAEFWFASIKIIALVVLIITGIVIFFGGGPAQNHVLGFHYWNDPGSFNDYLVPGSTGRFLGFWHALVLSGFAFVTSPELVAITAGESEAPRRNIPKAASRFVYRLAFFYCVGSLVISVIVPYNNGNLLSGNSDASASPFVVGIQLAGIPVLNHIVNAVILTSATSAANSFVYAASRNLYSLACVGQAPSIFKKCTKNGNVPIFAVGFTAALACLVYLSVSSGSAQAFNWFLNLTTISG